QGAGEAARLEAPLRAGHGCGGSGSAEGRQGGRPHERAQTEPRRHGQDTIAGDAQAPGGLTGYDSSRPAQRRIGRRGEPRPHADRDAGGRRATDPGTRVPRTDTLRIGTSGFVYPSWKGRFYPPALPASAWLSHYARHFDTVEIKSSFYRLPESSVFERWREAVPRGFTFAVKFSRFGTHMKRLLTPRAPSGRFLGRARRLGSHLGPILVRLPPRWVPDLPRLDRDR